MYALDVCTLLVYNTSMNFEWDESKRQTNIQKRGTIRIISAQKATKHEEKRYFE
jgi:uncharacterized DUF497 family protein